MCGGGGGALEHLCVPASTAGRQLRERCCVALLCRRQRRPAARHALLRHLQPRCAACARSRLAHGARPTATPPAFTLTLLPTATPPADGKTFKKPRRPYEKERLDAELKLVGEYGLRNKRELWRVQAVLSKIRNAARVLLTLDDKDPKRIFEGNALMRRMNRYGLLTEAQDKLDYVLALTPQVRRPG